MNRKIKIISAVISLCLAVTLMAFGVYAATSVSYAVSGNVSYSMTDVLVSIKATIERVADRKEGNTNLEQVSKLTYTGYGKSFEEYKSYDDKNIAYETATKTEQLDVTFNDSTAWKLTVDITTIDEVNTINISATIGSVAEGANYKVEAAEENPETVTHSAPAKLVFYIYLLDTTKAITSTNYSISLSLTR